MYSRDVSRIVALQAIVAALEPPVVKKSRKCVVL